MPGVFKRPGMVVHDLSKTLYRGGAYGGAPTHISENWRHASNIFFWTGDRVSRPFIQASLVLLC